ncbi:MAG TPA: ABC transporter permease [Candidatus Limnocylindrales bacterium]|nr:ABC transporter permease [Candidatus Limnocylindrales bacterium]
MLRRTVRVSVFLAERSLVRGNVGVTVMTIAVLLLIYIDLLFVPSLIQGAIDKINRQTRETLTSDVLIAPAHGARDISGVAAYLARIRSSSGVAAATATYRVGSAISHGDESNVWSIDAIDAASYGQVFRTPFNVIEGAALTAGNGNGILLGIQIAGVGNPTLRDYATSLRTVHAGDSVSIKLLTGQNQTVRVAGVFDDHFLLADEKAYVTQAWAEQWMPGVQDRATTIYVKALSSTSAQQLIARLAPLRKDIAFHSSAELAGSIKDEIDTFTLINNILKAITLFVALITVFIVTYVDLVNRRRQIGIERAIGIRPMALILSYVLKAIVYAFAGIALGALAFLYGAGPIVQQHPFEFPFGPATLGIRADEMWRDAAILVVVAAISAWVPAWRSVRMRILDAIWST